MSLEPLRSVASSAVRSGQVRTTQTEILFTTEEQGKPRDKRETRRSAKDAAQKALA